jgi:hypothetical protein
MGRKGVGKAQTEGKNVARVDGKKEDRESENRLKVSAQAPRAPPVRTGDS